MAPPLNGPVRNINGYFPMKKNMEKSPIQIFSRVFLSFFRHILRTTLAPFLIFKPHISLKNALRFRAISEFLSFIIFFLWIFKVKGRFDWMWKFENGTSKLLRLFRYANHYTWKSHELSYLWYTDSDADTEHPVRHGISVYSFRLENQRRDEKVP